MLGRAVSSLSLAPSLSLSLSLSLGRQPLGVLSNAAFGFLTDLIGPRIILGTGLAVLGVLTFAFSFAQSFTVGASIQLLMGLASGVDYSAGVKLITAWFGKPSAGALSEST